MIVRESECGCLWWWSEGQWGVVDGVIVGSEGEKSCGTPTLVGQLSSGYGVVPVTSYLGLPCWWSSGNEKITVVGGFQYC